MRLTQPKELSLAIGMALVSILIFSTNSNAANIEVTVETAGINNNATIDDINNSSRITGNVGGVAINNNGTIRYINNSGTINGSWIGINNNETITGVINNANGTITGEIGINANGPIGSIVNFGNITAAVNNGIGILVNHNSVSDITNNGSIVANYAGIAANYSVNTLANLQGAGNNNGALTLYGVLPTHYNIIINSNVNYGQLAVTNGLGNMAFNVYGYSGQTLTSSVSASSVSNRLYQNVLAGLAGTLSGSSITGTGFSISGAKGSYGGYGYTLVADDSNVSGVWDLFFGASTADTQSSLASQARRLRSTFNSTMASSNFANMNAYDCNLFDQNNMCISAGGRVTTIDNPSSHHSAAVVVLGYKVNSNIRIGGFLDQSINNNTPTGIQVSNKNPMMGAFAVWNKNADGLGYQLKIANAYQDKDVTTTREVIGSSEAGKGRTDLNTQSYVGELSYAFQYQDSTIVRPYFAVRYTNIKQDGYTEDTTASVTSPLTYAKLSDRSTTALMGVKLNHALTPRTNLTASLGIEQDINHQVDKLNATGFADLTSENFNNNIKRTRPVASAGAYYAVAKNQRLSGEVYYQQLPFQSTGSATAYFNYMIGF
jgi:hypothetical protein